MEHVCRLCLRTEGNMSRIFYEGEESTQLQLLIRQYCSVEVFQNDVLPKVICERCKMKLNSARAFREQCRTSDCKLREYYKITASVCSNSLFKEFQDASVQTEEKSQDQSSSRENSSSSKMRIERTVSTLLKTVSTKGFDGNGIQDLSCIVDAIPRDDCRAGNYDSSDDGTRLQESSATRTQNIPEENTEKATSKKKVKHTREKEKFKCHMCQKVYVSKKALLKHTEAHIREEIFTCNVCNKTFNSRDKLDEHSKKHSDSMDFKCEVCGMPFKEQVKLNFHLRVHGRGPPINTEKHYLCDVCSRTFASKSGLRFHLKSHTGSKPYMCKYCNKGFTIPSYRKRHERTHTGDKHFVCHICNTAFASANGLKYHLRIHTGEANYHCETCGKSFRRFKYLKEHNFTHTGERPFACKICGSAYGNSGSLFVHEKKCKSLYILNVVGQKDKPTVQVDRTQEFLLGL